MNTLFYENSIFTISLCFFFEKNNYENIILNTILHTYLLSSLYFSINLFTI